MHYTTWQWILFFFIYSFFGWVWESGYASVQQHHPVNRGFLHGPIIPIYGFGALSVLLSTLEVRDSVVLIFVFGMIGATLLEYITGWGMERIFHVKYWDYSNFKFNLNGYICLLASLGWGLFSVLLVRVIHVPIEGLVLSIRNAFGELMALVLTAATAVDVYHSANEAMDLRNMLEKLGESKEYIRNMQRRLEISSVIHFEDYKELVRQKQAERLSRRKRFMENLHAVRELRRQQLEELMSRAEELKGLSITSPEEFLKLRESISEEFQKLGARRDREYRRVAALLRRNPHAISKEHAEELQDLRNMME